MPSHTFTRVGLWRESINTNRRSYDAALREGAIAEALHAADYMTYAYLQLQQDSAARAIMDSLPSLAARFDPTAVTGAAPGMAGVFALAAIPARYALERRDWKAAYALRPTASAFPFTEALTYFAHALGAAHEGQLAEARADVDSAAIAALGARAWLEHAEHRPDDALAHMREAVVREDATEKSAVSPGPLAPARELMGDLLMELGRPAEALAEYRLTLEKEPNRYRSLRGAVLAARASGTSPEWTVTEVIGALILLVVVACFPRRWISRFRRTTAGS